MKWAWWHPCDYLSFIQPFFNAWPSINNQFDLPNSSITLLDWQNWHLIIIDVHRPHNRGSYYIKRKLHLIFFYVQLTNIKPNKPYWTYQKLRTAGYFNHDHPIAGILVSIDKKVFPKQSELRVKMFCKTNQISVDQMKSCQVALCLPHTMYGSTLSCFCMSSNTFLPNPPNFCVHTLPQCFHSCLATNRPHVQLTMLCYTKVRNKVVLVLKTDGQK